MKTKKTVLYGILALILAAAFTACPNDSSEPTLTGITAVYTGGSVAINTNVNSLKSNLTVTANYSDNTGKTLDAADYSLSGDLSASGQKTVTVTYEGKTTNFNVTVSATPIDITYTVARADGEDGVSDTTGIVFTFSASVDNLNLTATDITIGGTAEKDAAELTGTGTTRTLAITVNSAGTATVTIAKTGIEAGTKNLIVFKAVESAPVLTGITAVYTGTAEIYPTTPLNDLKAGLTVKAQYSDSSENTLSENEYTLSGTLTVGTSTVTVNYEGKTTTFTITVTASADPQLSGVVSISPNGGVTINTELTANYTGSETVSFQWYKDGTAISGATSDKYTPTEAGSYTVTVSTAGYTSKTSAAVTVTVTVTVTVVTLDVEQIIDNAPIIDDITISRANNGYPVTYTVTVDASDYDTGSINWEIAGVGAYAGQTVTGNSGSFTLYAGDVRYNSLGIHVLTLTVTKGGQQYQRAIPFTIVR